VRAVRRSVAALLRRLQHFRFSREGDTTMGVTFDRFKKTFNKKVSDDLLKVRQDKVREALKELKIAVETLGAIGADPEPHKSTLLGLLVQFNNLNKRPSQTNEELYSALDSVKDEARNAAKTAEDSALKAPEANTPEKQLLVQSKYADKKKPGALRKLAEDALNNNPKMLDKLADMPGGPAVIDELVEDLKGKAASPESQELVKKAMLARFKMKKVEGTLNDKSLPHLYKVLTMIPESHGRNNPKLAEIKVEVGGGGGDYTGGKLSLQCLLDDRDSFFADQFDHDPEDGTKKEWLAKGDDHHRFDATTLHEIGHAVDDNMGFMKKRTGDDFYGGWKRLTTDEVAQMVCSKSGFFARWNQYPESILRKMVVKCLDGSVQRDAWELEKAYADKAPTVTELLNDAGVKHAEKKRLEWESLDELPSEANDELGKAKSGFKSGLQKNTATVIIRMVLLKRVKADDAIDEVLSELKETPAAPSQQEWDIFIKDPLFAWCVAARKSDSWKLGAAHAKEVAKMDGHCYTKDKSGWYRYAFSARAKSISKYQFNTPAEWFAELYAAYYLKKLPKAHPDYKWMTDDVHNK
jgi:hypothetical protein